ncbi:MAG: hypothetical protein U1F65_02055 [Verrucomicrobiota bacterium]
MAVPNATNEVQFRLYTNAAPDASHLWNTFDLLAYGETLLESPGGTSSWHNLLVNDRGPELRTTNHSTLLEQAAGTNWSYVAFDATAGYPDRLTRFHRGILFVEPDLFVVWDHLVAREPAFFKMVLHAPDVSRVDPIWRDLRLELPRAGFRINAPSPRKSSRDWERVESAADKLFPPTATFQLGPTNRLASLDLLTVYCVHHGGEKKDFAFRLLETTSAVGVRIHRDGLPTLVAFKTDASATDATLAGFAFKGPVGVDVFTLKVKKP